jgi:hypothetical protein
LLIVVLTKPAVILVGAKGAPAGTPTWVDKAWVKEASWVNKVLNKVIVELPNKTGSVASLDPKNTLLEDKITFPVVSKLIDSTAFRLIDFLELNNKWSIVVLNTNLPDFKITCYGDWANRDEGVVRINSTGLKPVFEER